MLSDEQEILLSKVEQAMLELPEWQRSVILYDIDNNYEQRNSILLKEIGISTQVEISRYIQRLREKIRDMANGVWKPKHQNSKKKTLIGF